MSEVSNRGLEKLKKKKKKQTIKKDQYVLVCEKCLHILKSSIGD
jgi:hypothetical protein